MARVGRILASRDILLLTLSYISMNYVFYLLANWCFLYLIQERHFATLEGGVLASLPPFPVFVALNFVWGLGAGITMTQSRTVLQIVAPATHRARLMSLFQMGLGGGGPIGALIAGTICSIWGLQAALLLPAVAMMLLIGVVLARSRLWSMRTVE